MNKIEDIASQHLGRTSDGGTMTRYETPDEVDSSLLVGIPRYLNRTAYNISNEEFTGWDTWNAYEVSFLLDNGYPVSGVVKYVYDCNTPNIVESKSIKLYLNSFNMAKMGPNVEEATKRALQIMEKDLTECIGGEVKAGLHRNSSVASTTPVLGDYMTVENLVDVSSIVFDKYNEDPDILEVQDVLKAYVNSGLNVTRFHTNALRSNCRVTIQPDWGDVFIRMKGKNIPCPESVAKYIVSHRTVSHFHEEICEIVFKHLMDAYKPEDLMVSCLYTRRGGLDINPIRATHSRFIPDFFTDTDYRIQKTLRQ